MTALSSMLRASCSKSTTASSTTCISGNRIPVYLRCNSSQSSIRCAPTFLSSGRSVNESQWRKRSNSTIQPSCCSFTDDANVRKIFDSILPLPQVAFDYAYNSDKDDEADEHCSAFPRAHPFVGRSAVPIPTSSSWHSASMNSGKNAPSSDPYRPSSYTPYTTKYTAKSVGKGGGGGGGGTTGGGRYRCPKCGSYVSFRHEDFEENTFYCATCSGWFLVSPSNNSEGDKGGSASLNEALKADGFHLRQQLAMSYNPTQMKDALGGGGKSSMEEPTNDDSTSAKYADTSSTSIKFSHRVPTPIEICRGLDEYVIGQPSVKMALSVGVYNHYKRIAMAEANALRVAVQKNANGSPDGMDMMDIKLSTNSATVTDAGPTAEGIIKGYCEVSRESIRAAEEDGQDQEMCEIDKSNIIIIGPTGSGKTLLVKTLARFIDVPIVIADATCLTQAGYVGEDVESILLKLYHEAGQDLERCQKGIVYIDEADKIRKSGGNISISRDVSGEGVQHALLKIVEGNVINVPKEPGRKNPRGDFLAIDTTNILFICGGAFSGLEKIINRRLDAASIGFGAQMKKNLEDHDVQGKYFDNATPKDLVEYGMIPEFIGRFPVIESTKGLDVKNLIEILTVPKNSLMKQYKVLFAKDGVNFHYTQCALEEIAKIAFTRGSGARGLRSITENILMETMFVVPSIPEVHTVYLDAEAVRRDRKPVLLKHPDMTVEKYEELKKQGLHNEAVGAEPVHYRSDEENEPAVA